MPPAMNRSDGNGNHQAHRRSRLPPPAPSNGGNPRTRTSSSIDGGSSSRKGRTSNPNALTRREADASWSRVLSRRVRQLRTLKVRQLGEIEGLLGRDPNFPPPPPAGDTTETHVGYLRGVLERHFKIALDSKLRNELRSKSLDTVKRLLTAIDEQYAAGGPPRQQQQQRQPGRQQQTQQGQQQLQQQQGQQQQGELQQQQKGRQQQQQQQQHRGGDRVADESDRSRPQRRQQEQKRGGSGCSGQQEEQRRGQQQQKQHGAVEGSGRSEQQQPQLEKQRRQHCGGDISDAPAAKNSSSKSPHPSGAAPVVSRSSGSGSKAPPAAAAAAVASRDPTGPPSSGGEAAAEVLARKDKGEGTGTSSREAGRHTGSKRDSSVHGGPDHSSASASAGGGVVGSGVAPPKPQDRSGAPVGGAVVAGGKDATAATNRSSSSPPARSSAVAPSEAVVNNGPGGGGEGDATEGGPPSFVAALFAPSNTATSPRGAGTAGDRDRAGASGGGGGGSASLATTLSHTRADAAKKGSDGRGAASNTPSRVQAGGAKSSGDRDGGGGCAAAAARTRVIAAKKMGSTSSMVASAFTSDGKKGAPAVSSSPKPKPPPAAAEKAKSTVAGKLAQLTSTRGTSASKQMGSTSSKVSSTPGGGTRGAPASSSAGPDAVPSGAVKNRPPPPTEPQRVVTADFQAESPKTSYLAALTPRVPCRVFHSPAPSTAVPDRDMRRSFEERLDMWDPYWRRVHDVADFHLDTTAKTDGGAGRDKVVEVRDSGYFVTTSPVIRTEPELYSSSPGENQPRTCLAVTFELPKEVAAERGSDGKAISWGVAGKTGQQPEDGERRMLVRMLPLTPPVAGAGRRADTHLWPKGTFLQVNGKPVRIRQRRQQSHDPKLWKGMCEPLDLTPFVSDPMGRNTLSLLTREDAPYGVQIAIVEYRGPRSLLAEAVASKEVIPYDESVELARRYVGAQTVVLDDSDDDDGGHGDGAGGCSSSLTWQLTCPMAMRTMEVPARGRNCKHMQCFDLFTFLHANSFPSGRRWMCPACDRFVSLEDAVLCGLFREMIRRHKDEVDDGADRVNFCADGTWTLAAVKKRGATGDGAVIRGTKRKKAPEVILL